MFKILLLIHLLIFNCFGETEYINPFTNVKGKVTTSVPVVVKIESFPKVVNYTVINDGASNKRLGKGI